MRTSRSMGGKKQAHGTQDAPVPAVRCKCYTIRSWSHQATFLYMREILSKTEPSPCLHLNRDRVRIGVVLDGKVGWRWGAEGEITSLYFIISYPSENDWGFISAFYWPGTPVHFQCPKEEPTQLQASRSQQYTRAALSLGEDGHVAITLASKFRQGLQDTEVCAIPVPLP